MKDYLFTSESVSEGHPDKVADAISDNILDLFLSKDNEARVAVETLVTTNKVVIAGEIRSKVEVTPDEREQVIRNLVKEIGYDSKGFDYKTLEVVDLLHEQSADIAMGVDEADGKEEGAGDQGIMFGYACQENHDYMPAAIYYSHHILRKLSEKRKSGQAQGLLPDSKAQITFMYRDGKPVAIDNILVSHQHSEELTLDDVRHYVNEAVFELFHDKFDVKEEQILVNPTGRFVIGGPDGDTGLTGRKIIVDTYGGSAPHGGGAFSGKDPTKVDRSAAYIARYLAKNIVAAGIAQRCTIQLSYAIGLAEPRSIYINTRKTSKVDESRIIDFINENVSLTPKAIRERLQMNNPIYAITSSYGHFGRKMRDGLFTWENLDLVDKLQSELL